MSLTINDISEFGNREYKSDEDERVLNFGDQLIERFVDIPVFISLNGFKLPAQEFGMLNGICLIDHSKTPEILDLTEKIRKMIEEIPSFSFQTSKKNSKRNLAMGILNPNYKLPDQFENSQKFIEQRKIVLTTINSIFSIFGSIDERVPIHITAIGLPELLDLTSDVDAIIEKSSGTHLIRLFQKNQEVFVGHFTIPELYTKYVTLRNSTTKKRRVKAQPLQKLTLFFKTKEKSIFLTAKIIRAIL